ncbi:MAG: DUF3473 domain-containing protein [Planctomycetia bacterium]|nr:DUF3473 domain-containing protein [Planctomycetia bacterium]
MAVEPVKNAMTVDVEDFYQVSAFEQFIPAECWETYPQRVHLGLMRILDTMERRQVRGTYFILGWVAEHFPELVREIANRGHEIGFHSRSHQLIYNMTPEDFREDIHRGKALLEEVAGREVRAFRAPSFSITEKSLWALDILAEEGFLYDSSIFPIHHDRYGIPNANIHIHALETVHGEVREFPPAVVRKFGQNLPVSGGGYFRLYPYWLTRRWLRQINRERPFVFYIHPWELDPEQPRLPFGSRATQFRHRVGLRKNAKKLDCLLRDFSFGPLSEVIDQNI